MKDAVFWLRDRILDSPIEPEQEIMRLGDELKDERDPAKRRGRAPSA